MARFTDTGVGNIYQQFKLLLKQQGTMNAHYDEFEIYKGTIQANNIQILYYLYYITNEITNIDSDIKVRVQLNESVES